MLRTLPELLAVHAAARPDHTALRLAGGTGQGAELTASEWLTRSHATGHGLLDRGVRPGDRVALVFDGSGWLDYAVAYAAVTGVGAVAVPLSASLPDARLRELYEHAGVTATVGTGGWSLSALDSGRTDPPPVTVEPGQLAQIVYTSGTTGTPKGVAAAHGNLTHGLDPARPPLRHSRHALHAFPLGTNAAQTMLVMAMVAHPTMVVLPAFDAADYARAAAAHRAGSLFLVPAMATGLLEAGAFDHHGLDFVELVSCTAAALPPAVAKALAAALPEAVIVNNYTSTEAAPAHTSMVFDPDRPASVGRPAGGADLRILAADGEPAAPGETGEVWLRAGDTARAYHGDAAATAATFRDGWVRMGDLGYLDPDGYLYLVDRESDLINAGAWRVSTLRVEAALHEHPQVVTAAALGLPHPVLGATVAAAVVLRDPAAAPDLRAFLADRLAAYELPTRILTVPELPRNASGKVLKGALRELFAQRPARVAPRTEAESALAGLWREVLGAAEVGVGDDFFALGGDSMRATRLAAAATARLGVDVPVSLVFDHPVLAAQATRLADLAPSRRDSATAVDTVPLSSTQESMLAWMWATGEPRDVGPISIGIRVRDQLDPDLLERALTEVIGRHESLRTVFERDVARVLDSCPPVVTRAAARDAGHAGELCREDREGGFDTTRGPLVRAMVASVADDDHVLGLAVHHLVFDGASMGVLLRELGLAYSALRTGAGLPPVPALTVRDFVSYTRNRWQTTLPHWRAVLDGAPANLVPFAGRRTATRLRSAQLEWALDPALVDGLHRAAAAHGATPFMVIASCWAAALAERTGTDDIVLMSPVPGRTLPGSEALIGCLSQSLLLRVDTSGPPSARELLRRTRAAALAALDHQHYPFVEFYRRHPGAAWLRVESWAGQAHFPGLDSEAFELPRALDADWPTPGGEPDLQAPELAVVQHPGGRVAAHLLWNHHTFDRSTMDELADRVTALLARAVGELDPQSPTYEEQ
ncbi:AMP-binding protein [Catellatospora sp. KI3]|uniref:class I adenylate-forming enzyme family protein n=1 Tax=Catellatospora sp. KI3 TaxID=3041620 RepID=UPI002482D94D|nr:AMP-binding protein [Catellatospora sp. KI3]MDI1463174.1 AMP-binding protein [Catellatospora sp. KI3]